MEEAGRKVTGFMGDVVLIWQTLVLVITLAWDGKLSPPWSHWFIVIMPMDHNYLPMLHWWWQSKSTQNMHCWHEFRVDCLASNTCGYIWLTDIKAGVLNQWLMIRDLLSFRNSFWELIIAFQEYMCFVNLISSHKTSPQVIEKFGCFPLWWISALNFIVLPSSLNKQSLYSNSLSIYCFLFPFLFNLCLCEYKIICLILTGWIWMGKEQHLPLITITEAHLTSSCECVISKIKPGSQQIQIKNVYLYAVFFFIVTQY